jgi:cytidylate kinase
MSIVEGGVVCNGHFLNEDILKSPVVNDLVPQIAAIPEVRDVVVRLVHKTTASLDSWIIGGRSPDEHPADCILWITADPEIRAQRLMQEMQRNGESVSLEKAMVILNWRDTQDMKREISPMYRPNDALVVDTTSLTIDEAIECAHQLLA